MIVVIILFVFAILLILWSLWTSRINKTKQQLFCTFINERYSVITSSIEIGDTKFYITEVTPRSRLIRTLRVDNISEAGVNHTNMVKVANMVLNS